MFGLVWCVKRMIGFYPLPVSIINLCGSTRNAESMLSLGCWCDKRFHSSLRIIAEPRGWALSATACMLTNWVAFLILVSDFNLSPAHFISTPRCRSINNQFGLFQSPGSIPWGDDWFIGFNYFQSLAFVWIQVEAWSLESYIGLSGRL